MKTRSVWSFVLSSTVAASLGLTSCGGAKSGAPGATPPVASASAAPVTSAAPSSAPSSTALAVVGAADRSEADRELDGGRHPAETLTFFGIGPGMKVGEVAAGGGYTTELLARAVGPSGA